MYRKCSEVALKISEIIDHEASFMTSMRFYTHLMVCSKCRDYFSQFKLLKKVVGTPTPDQLPSDFDKVMKFVMKEIDGDGLSSSDAPQNGS